MGENCHGNKKVYIVSDDHYFKFFILHSAVITIQKVCGTVSGFVQVQQGRCDNIILHRQKRLLSEH